MVMVSEMRVKNNSPRDELNGVEIPVTGAQALSCSMADEFSLTFRMVQSWSSLLIVFSVDTRLFSLKKWRKPYQQ